MKTNRICALVISSLAIVTMLAGCTKKGNDSSSSSETSSSESSESSSESSSQAESVVLSSVTLKQSLIEYQSNSTRSSSEANGYIYRERVYEVGDDNAFNIKPNLTVLDGTTWLPVNPDRWTYDFNITAKREGDMSNATSEYFSVVDAAKCDVKFTSAAVGSTFTITVAPTHVEESQLAGFTKSFTVKVVDGYNVYNAKELGYMDTREADSAVDEEGAATSVGFVNKWQEFKVANNMDVNLKPNALILHNDVSITKDDIPSNFFFTADEVGTDTKSIGSLKDRVYVYKRTTKTMNGSEEVPFQLIGNYFTIDYSTMPLITRHDNKLTDAGKVVAHSALFRTDIGSASFKNVSIKGNAPKSENTLYGGGLMMIKTTKKTTAMNLDNFIAVDCYITIMTELPDAGYPVLVTVADGFKCSNNYNSFLYNWGGQMDIRNSSFIQCGGPILIQDHTAPGDAIYENTDEGGNPIGTVINGHASKTVFTDCVLRNYVSGEEAWFVSFGADVIAPTIKAMSDLLAGSGVSKGFATQDKVTAVVTQLATNTTFMNLIAVNKSSAAEGMTPYNVCGRVEINTSGDSQSDPVVPPTSSEFDYRQPANDPVYVAYVAYSADPTNVEKQAAFAQACAAKGVNPTDSAAVQAYITGICTKHVMLRGLNDNGAPVFDLGNDLPLATVASDSATKLSTIESVAAYSPVDYSLTEDQNKSIGDYCAIYYSGMMLLLGALSYPTPPSE